MISRVVGGILFLSIASALAQVADRVEVRYVHPEKFTDAGRYWDGDRSREVILAALAGHIERRAAQLLPEGQRLAVSISDLDMAGAYEPWRRNLGDIRVFRDIYPARIDLSFQLTAADGSVLRRGERRLLDMAWGFGAVGYRDDPLRHEKALLDGLLERELPRQLER